MRNTFSGKRGSGDRACSAKLVADRPSLGSRIRASVLAALLLVVLGSFAVPAAQANVGGFEGGDGTQVAGNCSSALDWQCLSSSQYLAVLDPAAPNDNSFIGSNKEDDPDSWVIAPSSVSTAKADVQAVWSYASTNASHDTNYLDLAFKRASGAGNSYLAFELNQSNSTYLNSAGTPVTCRTDGDVIISFNISPSSAVSAQLYKWQWNTGPGLPAPCTAGATGSFSGPLTVPASDLELAINAGSIVNYLSTAAVGASFPTGTFGEAAVNLSAVASALSQSATCVSYNHLQVTTRTSSSISSTLEDFVQGSKIVASSCQTGGGGTLPNVAITSPPDNTTQASSTVVLTGTSDQPQVEVLDGTTVVGDPVVDGSGNWTLTLTGVANGLHAYSAVATNSAGSTTSNVVHVTVSALPNVAITSPADNTTQGSSTVVLNGTSDQSQVEVYDGTADLGPVSVDGSGNWTLTLNGVTAGVHTYTAVATNSAGSVTSNAVHVTVVAPPNVAITSPADNTSQGSSTVVLSGTSDQSQVEVYDGTTDLGSASVDGSGNWTLTLNGVAAGTHPYSAVATDLAGSTTSNVVHVTVVAPPNVAITSPADNTSQGSSTVVLNGTSDQPQVEVYDGTTDLGSVSVDGSGNWTLTLNGVAAGTHAYSAVATDLAGSTTSNVVHVTVVAPPNVAIASPADNTSQDSHTVVLTGTSDQSQVELYDGTTDLGPVIVDGSGHWTLTLNGVADGSHDYSAVATDSAGSTTSNIRHLTVHTASAPAAAAPAAAQPAATPAAAPAPATCKAPKLTMTDVAEKRGRVQLEGAADASLIGQSVAIIFNGKQVASATVGSDGRFNAAAPLPPKRLRSGNGARYVAEAGGLSSLNLKLQRRLILIPPTSSGGKVRLVGQVVLPLAKPVAAVVVQQQLSCTKAITVARVRPGKDGRFSVTVTAPADLRSAVYRVETAVPHSTHSRKLFATFSLPQTVLLR